MILIHAIVLIISFYRIIVSQSVSDKTFSKYEKNIAGYKCREKNAKNNRKLVEIRFVFIDGHELVYERYDLSCSRILEKINKDNGDLATFYLFELFWYKNIVQIELNNEVLKNLDQTKQGIVSLFKVIIYVCIPMALLGFFVRSKFRKKMTIWLNFNC